MKTRSICLALSIVMLWSYASGQWVQTVLDSGVVNSIAVSGNNLFVSIYDDEIARDIGVFRSTNNGTSWTGVGNPCPSSRLFVISDTLLFAVGDGVHQSTDDGVNWSQAGLKGYGVLCLGALGTGLFAGTYGTGFALSTDSGTDWTLNRIQQLGQWESVKAIRTSGMSLFAGGDYGRRFSDMGGTEGFFVSSSTDNGASWITTHLSAGSQSSFLSLAVLGTALFASTTSGVFLIADNDTNWSVASTPFSTFAEILQIGTNNFAATSNGVFLSTDDGTNWTADNDGLSNTNITALTVSGTELVAGTSGSGVWRRPLSEMITSVEPVVTELPSKYLLNQNFPNPFNPITTIKYELPKSSAVRLSVYDLLGREVSVLLNDRRDARVHEVKFDGSNLASGVYFYRLQAGDFVQTKRLLLLK